MAYWCDAKVFFCILFIYCCCTVTVAQVPLDCCLMVGNKEIKQMFIVHYREQPKGCAIKATILVTRHGKNLCAPTKQTPWVEKVMKDVDQRKKICKEKNYKGNRCFGVKPQ